METNKIKFCRHIYHLSKKSASKTYEKVNNTVHRSVLTDTIKLQQSGGKTEIYFCVTNPRNWDFGSRVSVLLETNLKNVFEGNLSSIDTERPEPGTLLFCEFSANHKVLVIDVFPGFYTQNPFAFSLLLEKHDFLLRKKPGSKESLA